MAALSSWSYARLRARQAKTGQRVRLGAVITPVVGSGPFNLTERTGHFARTSDRLSSPYFAITPPWGVLPFEHDTAIAGGAGCTEARFAFVETPRTIVLICNDGETITERVSADEGYTFSAPVNRFSSAEHPDILATKSGILLELAYKAGEIVGHRQVPAGATPSAEFTLQDDAAADIAVEDDVFRLVEAANGWLWLHARPAGGGGTQLYFSTDIDTGPTQSFAETSGAVSGITSGEHPGICHAAPTGTLYAWALIGTSGWITHRHPGSTAWATPVEMVDDNGDPLELAAQSFSIAAAWETPARLVLSAITVGETLVSEWWSADPAGESWTLFSSS